MTSDKKKAEFVKSIADYVETHPDYEKWSKRDAAEAVAQVLVGDIGCAQEFIYTIGLDIDLYKADYDNICGCVPTPAPREEITWLIPKS